MIIWNGLGFMVAVIIFGFSLLANMISNHYYGTAYYSERKWPLALSLLCSGVICWFFGKYLAMKSDIIAVEKETGKEIIVNRSSHTLFFIPMQWWSPILIVWAIVLLVQEFSPRQ